MKCTYEQYRYAYFIGCWRTWGFDNFLHVDKSSYYCDYNVQIYEHRWQIFYVAVKRFIKNTQTAEYDPRPAATN